MPEKKYDKNGKMIFLKILDYSDVRCTILSTFFVVFKIFHDIKVGKVS